MIVYDNAYVHTYMSSVQYKNVMFIYSDPLSVPRLTVNTATSTGVEYRVESSDTDTTRIITGYEVFRFGVPMIGEYVNAGSYRGGTVTISPAVPGAQYRITAWALGNANGSRSATPAVKTATTGGTSEWRLH